MRGRGMLSPVTVGPFGARLARLLVAGGLWLAAAPALAVPCPTDAAGAIEMRFVVFEPNLDPPADRGLGEVFAYAYERGESTAGTRFIAVSDRDGVACIEGTGEGDWTVTVFEPFVFRPVVREASCGAGVCDLGTIRLDTALRVSDDYVDFGSGWFGGPFAQTLTVPAGAVSVAKITFRDGATGPRPLDVYAGDLPPSGAPLASSGFRIDGPGGRDSALFAPGALPVAEGDALSLVIDAGWAPWRVGGDPLAGGAMYAREGDTWTEIGGVDLAFNLDLDGVDGTVTSHLALGTDGSVQASWIAQRFVARSRAITHASLFVGPPDGLRRMRAQIAATPDGPPIGPVRETQGLQQQGVAFAWADGEVPVTPGETYYLRVDFPEGRYGVYTRRDDARGVPLEPAGSLIADGSPAEGLLWGRILGPIPDPEPPLGDAGTTSPDGGPGAPDGGARDAGLELDGGASEVDGGCGCAAGAPPRPALPWPALALPLLLLGRRRRRSRPRRLSRSG